MHNYTISYKKTKRAKVTAIVREFVTGGFKMRKKFANFNIVRVSLGVYR